MKAGILGIIFVFGLGMSNSVFGAMSSTNFSIQSDTLSSGGDQTSSSSSYLLRDSVLTQGAGSSSSSSYELSSGFGGMIFDPIVTLDVGVQETAVRTDVSGLSGTSLTVGSTSGFSVGDMVVLGQDVSSSPVMATGEIVSIVGSVIEVDELVSYGTPSIDGDDDVLYRASGSSVSFGVLQASLVSRSVVTWRVSVDVTNGFVVYLAEDGDLASGLNSIADVSDGEVTAGSSEYGARSSDTSLAASTFDTADTAITSTPQQIATVSSGQVRFHAKGFVELKASRSTSSVVGSYANSLYVVAAPTY